MKKVMMMKLEVKIDEIEVGIEDEIDEIEGESGK